MDPLSDVLTLLNVGSALSSRFEAGGRWALRFRSYRHIKIGAITSGACWLTIDGTPALRLSTGDCYLLTGGRPYEVAGDLDVEAEDGHAVYLDAPNIRNVRYGTTPDAEPTVIIGGSITLDDMTALMHQQATRRWTVAGLAAEVDMSRSSFALRFKTLVGLPPLDYLPHWRIRSAAEALRAGDRTVASVASEWGYASESAFSNAFKRVTGQPPARYRTAKPPPPAAPPVYE